MSLKKNTLIPEGYGGVRGHLTNLGKLPNHWTVRDQIWHTYTDSSGNGHRLKINPSSSKGHLEGVRRSRNPKCGKEAKQLDRSGTNFGHVCIIHLGIDMS